MVQLSLIKCQTLIYLVILEILIGFLPQTIFGTYFLLTDIYPKKYLRITVIQPIGVTPNSAYFIDWLGPDQSLSLSPIKAPTTATHHHHHMNTTSGKILPHFLVRWPSV